MVQRLMPKLDAPEVQYQLFLAAAAGAWERAEAAGKPTSAPAAKP
ncbi:MAG TPA: hypothetical protein VM389_07290 [Phycisphaerae bacterium]|nr:hypothetical protein [Phycisphaerae bacterium]HUU22326.1 hypothetical protein [Phycisphaerae bacterium]